MIVSYNIYSLLWKTLTKGNIIKKLTLLIALSALSYSAPGYTAGSEADTKEEMGAAFGAEEGAWQAAPAQKPAAAKANAQWQKVTRKAEEEEEKLAQLTAQVEQTQQDMKYLNDQILLAYAEEEEDGNEGADAKVQLLDAQISAMYERMEGAAYAKVQLLKAHAAYAEQVDAQAPAAHKRWSDAFVEWNGIKKEWQEWQEAGEDTEEEEEEERSRSRKISKSSSGTGSLTSDARSSSRFR